MFRRIGKEYENKGATLVLVIVCMLFVGIIAAAILTLTTGNINSTKTSEGESNNFYSAESVIDDLKVYFQKVANSAATEAYAKMLDDVAAQPGIDMEASYAKHFKEILNTKMQYQLNASNADSIVKILADKDYAALGVAGGYKTISIDATKFSYDETARILKGVTLVYTDDADNTVTIDTDMQFDCKMPPFSWDASDNAYEYNVDKFIVISEAGIESAVGNTNGTVTGSLYSGNDIDVTLATSDAGVATLNVNSQYIITKGDLIVDNGKLNISGLGDGTVDRKYLDLKRTETTATLKSQPDANLWVGGITLKANKPEVKIDDSDAKVYVKDDLSLDANDSKFTMTQGDYYGFSSDNTVAGSVSAHNPSSAIVINGVGSVLNMSDANSLTLAGTAYTQVPQIAGFTPASNCTYFVQGESVTFKSLQSAYLVPGEYIEMTGAEGGYNPIPDSEWSKFQGVKTGDISTKGVHLNGIGYRTTTVKYVNSDAAQVYHYVYWDFSTVGDAVQYFNSMYNTNKELIESKIGMIGNGSISLPSNVYSKGDLIGYSGSASNILSHRASNWTGSNDKAADCSTYEASYNKYIACLSDETSVSSDLFDNLFRNGNYDLVKENKTYNLQGPQAWSTSECSYSGHVLNKDGQSDGESWKYKLITGGNITLSGLALDTKYVVIADGDVTVSGETFNGIIIAKGKVKIGTNVNMTCFGNFYNTITDKSTNEAKSEFISEFDALLNVTVDSDKDLENGNTVLRNIFGVAGYTSSGAGTSGNANDIASVGTVNYKKN